MCSKKQPKLLTRADLNVLKFNKIKIIDLKHSLRENSVRFKANLRKQDLYNLLKDSLYDNYLNDSNKVKVLVDGNKGLDFYRTNPNSSHHNCKVLHHIGIYAFTAGFLNLFAKIPPTVNEEKLKLEQLRAIENGFPINVLELELKNSWGIDTEEDLKKLRDYLKAK